ncbi:MAG: YggS family pyridoxal phosphate-dependent enzyme [Verrucomicrobia bacterium]|nr:YggS family pyridoxal phosphate-dependent enzyme [Verrucomicrobiota bacterium]MCH8512672.1 YggS family pyridoxal phosphate-dependent enzyme [Kiritimatiellia bacterium]
MQNLIQNIYAVESRIQAACDAAHRKRDEVTLVAVSKKKPADLIRAAYEAGLSVFGENRVQEAMVKIPELPNGISWHLIGHLQTNKVKQVIHCEFSLIHSVDSERLLLALENAAEEQGRTQPILLQVNVSGEASKFGLPPQELLPLLETAAGCTHLEVQGLMTIPPLTEDPEKAAPHFARLRTLRDEAAQASGFPLETLSMGMSHDLEVAIREGATFVRVGTDIFGAREKNV